MRFLFHGTKEDVEAKLSSGGLGKGRCAISRVYAPARWLPWRAVVTRSGGQAPRPRLENSSVCLKATGAELVLSGWAASGMMIDYQDLWIESNGKRSTQRKREGTQVCSAAPCAELSALTLISTP